MNCVLGDIAEVIMGQSPKSEFYNTEGQGMPFLQGNRTFGKKFPVFDTYTTMTTKTARAGDVIMSVRAPVGDLNITPVDMCLGRGVCGIRMKNGNQDFLFYLLKHYMPQLLNKESGTVFGSVNRSDINGLELNIPEDENEQRCIARILAMLDEKIESNDSINDNLEQQLHTLFDAYFIDLKSLDSPALKHTDFGVVPETWQVMPIGDTKLDISDGNYSSKYPKQDEFLSFGIPFIRGTDFNGVSISQESMYYISPEKHSELKKGHTKQGDILITTRGDIGRIAFVPDSLVDVNINSQLVRINGASLVPRSYLGCFLTSKRVQDDIRSLISGSALQQLPIGKLKRVLFLLPDANSLNEFDALAEPIYQKMFFNNDENIRLSALRDTLLPKLMSGELDVSTLNL